MMTATLVYLACIALMLAFKAWYEADARTMQAPQEGTYGDAQAWAETLEAELATPAEKVHTRCVDMGIALPTWDMPLILAIKLGMARALPLSQQGVC